MTPRTPAERMNSGELTSVSRKQEQSFVMKPGRSRGRGSPRIERSARIAALTPGSAISAIGRIVAAEAVRFGAVELVVEAIEVQSLADAPLPIAADSTLEKQIDWRQISLRRPEQFLVFAVQNDARGGMLVYLKRQECAAHLLFAHHFVHTACDLKNVPEMQHEIITVVAPQSVVRQRSNPRNTLPVNPLRLACRQPADFPSSSLLFQPPTAHRNQRPNCFDEPERPRSLKKSIGRA